jgi:hypothetical protein
LAVEKTVENEGAMYPQRTAPRTTPPPAQPAHPPVPGERNGGEAPLQVIRTTVPGRNADAPPAVVATTPQGLVQAVEGLARCLERVLEAVGAESARGALESAADELRQAKTALGLPPAQGELSKKGRDAAAAQRADPAHSPHFGG